MRECFGSTQGVKRISEQSTRFRIEKKSDVETITLYYGVRNRVQREFVRANRAEPVCAGDIVGEMIISSLKRAFNRPADYVPPAVDDASARR